MERNAAPHHLIATAPDAPIWFTLLFSIVFLLVGGVLLLIGILTLLQERKRELVYTQGEVIRIEPIRSTDGDGSSTRTYRPTFRFDTPDGTVERPTGGESSANWNYPLGRRLSIAYDPDDESCVRPAGWANRWLASALFTLIGTATAAVGLLTLISAVTR